MPYLAASDYEHIRSDPSQIVDLFNEHRNRFIADAGLHTLAESLQVAAFCTVVAYDLAPYGRSDAGFDVSALLAAPVLNCAQFAMLTLFLVEEFDTSAAACHIVGWDGGAVGNHAQIFITDEGSSALLDPTVGLIVPGATLVGVATGTPYADMVSFFDPNRPGGSNITRFDASVRSAITDGSYEIRDGIYNVPSFSEWQTSFMAHVGLIVGDVRSGWIEADKFSWAGTAYGGRGNDTITGSDNEDSLFGGRDDDRLLGLSGSDRLYGEEGNDRLDGGAGADRLHGGPGNDIYRVGSSTDAVIEGWDSGRDIVVSTVCHIALTTNVENAQVLGSRALNVRGNSLDNAIYGNEGANVLDGMSGSDRIYGRAGRDFLLGNSGGDYLEGGTGVDVLAGGSGADTFVWRHIAETGIYSSTADLIRDFSRIQGDRIHLNWVDADSTTSGDQAFEFIGVAPFTGAGQIRSIQVGEETRLILNTDSDSASEGVVRISGLHQPDAPWFVL